MSGRPLFIPLHLAARFSAPARHATFRAQLALGNQAVSIANCHVPARSASSTTSNKPTFPPFVSRVSHLGPLSTAMLSAGAALVSLADPSRADMVALLGELTAAPALRKMREQMMTTEEGQQILREKPRIRQGKDLDFEKLLALPHDTFGYAYASFMTKHGFSPDERHQATCIAHISPSTSPSRSPSSSQQDDATATELAYVLQRYREVHDLWHTLSDLPPSVLGEAAVKWLEMVQTGLPMASLAAMASPLRMSNADRQVYFKHLVPWASKVGRSCVPLMAVRYEALWELPIDEVRARLKFEPAPKWQ